MRLQEGSERQCQEPHVLLMTRGRVLENRGGSVFTVERLLATHNEADASSAVRMSAVFGDKWCKSYDELSRALRNGHTSGDSAIRGVLKRPFPRSLRFGADVSSSTMRYGMRIEQAIRGLDSGPVVLHSHDLISSWIAALRYRHKYPLIFTVHGKGGYVREPLMQHPVYKGTPIEGLLRRIERKAIRHADVVVFTSKGSRDLLEEEYKGILQDKDVRIVHVAVDTAELDGALANAGHFLSNKSKDGVHTILCIAALVKDKGVDALVEAIAALPDDIRSNTECLIVGRGHLEGELHRLIEERGLCQTVKMQGFLSRGELLQLMASATVFVLPSVVSVFDAVLLEVATIGRPVITTAVGGNLEMFDTESAILVPPSDPQALAAAIAAMVSNPDMREQIADNARRRIRSKFSPTNQLESYIAIYRELARCSEAGC